MLKKIIYEIKGRDFIKTIAFEILRRTIFLRLLFYIRYNFFVDKEYPIYFKSKNENLYIKKIDELEIQNVGSVNWLKKLKNLKSELKKKGFKKFLRSPTIIETMFVNDKYYTKIQYEFLKNRLTDISLIYENNIGNPILSKIDKKTSANLIHHAYHYENFIDFVGEKTQIENVFEFGAGYGSLARYVIKRNQNLKSYFMYDFKIFNIISEYYLSCQFDHLNLKFLNHENLIDINQFNLNKSLFISTWALSESPIVFRKQFEPFMKKFDYLLIAYQKEVDEYKNHEYFNTIFNDSFIKKNFEINFFKNNFYLFLKRSQN